MTSEVLSARAQSELVEQTLVVAPILSNFHVEVEIDPAPEHLFELVPGFGADALDHLAAAAHHDWLLGLAVDEDGRDDARHGRRFDPIMAKRYREGDHDYDRQYGSRDDYKRDYRAAFEQGYNEGYRIG